MKRAKSALQTLLILFIVLVAFPWCVYVGLPMLVGP